MGQANVPFADDPSGSDPLVDRPQFYETTIPDSGPERPRLPSRIGRYHIQQHLGRGGFADIYLAFDPELQRHVALKVARPGDDRIEQLDEAFRREARITAQWEQAPVVTVYDVGRTAEHGIYIAMEYLPGSTLAARLANGILPLSETLRIVAQVAQAIHQGHKLGLIHRDLKPSNILFTAEGTPKVSDYGLPHPPRRLVFDSATLTNSETFDQQLGRFLVNTDGWGMFSFRDNSPPGFELRTTVVADAPSGKFGLF